MARVGSILVAFPGHRDPAPLVHVALSLVEHHGARLSLVSVAPKPPLSSASWFPFAAPWSLERLRQDALDEAERTCAHALRAIPADVSVEFRISCGRPSQVVASLLDVGAYDSLVVHAQLLGRLPLWRLSQTWRRPGRRVEVRRGQPYVVFAP